ncbi:hypothetical protein HDU86_004163 [Geranomyces michiganensis]|nr:hypothetical protein HDU86_004163 [Geranomyces michiganensis]
MLKGLIKVAGFGGGDSPPEADRIVPELAADNQDGKHSDPPVKQDSVTHEELPAPPIGEQDDMTGKSSRSFTERSTSPSEFRLPDAHTALAADEPTHNERTVNNVPEVTSTYLGGNAVALDQKKSDVGEHTNAPTMTAQASAFRPVTPLESYIEPPSPSDPHAKPTVSSGTATKAVPMPAQTPGRTMSPSAAFGPTEFQDVLHEPKMNVKLPQPLFPPATAAHVKAAMPPKYGFVFSDALLNSSAAGCNANSNSDRNSISAAFNPKLNITAGSSYSLQRDDSSDDGHYRVSLNAATEAGAYISSLAPDFADLSTKLERDRAVATASLKTGESRTSSLQRDNRISKLSPNSDSSRSTFSTISTGDGQYFRSDGCASISDRSATQSFIKLDDEEMSQTLKQPQASDEVLGVPSDLMDAPALLLSNSPPKILASKEKIFQIHPLEKDTHGGNPVESHDISVKQDIPSRDPSVAALSNPESLRQADIAEASAALLPERKSPDFTHQDRVQNIKGPASAGATVDLVPERKSEDKYGRPVGDTGFRPRYLTDGDERQLSPHRGRSRDTKRGRGTYRGKANSYIRRGDEHRPRASREDHKRVATPDSYSSYGPDRTSRTDTDRDLEFLPNSRRADRHAELSPDSRKTNRRAEFSLDRRRTNLQGELSPVRRSRTDIGDHSGFPTNDRSKVRVHARNPASLEQVRRHGLVLQYDEPGFINVHAERASRIQQLGHYNDINGMDEAALERSRIQGYAIGFTGAGKLRGNAYRTDEKLDAGSDLDPYEQRTWRDQRFLRDDIDVIRLEEQALAVDRRRQYSETTAAREPRTSSRKRDRADERHESGRDFDRFEPRIDGSARSNERDFDPYEQPVARSHSVAGASSVSGRLAERGVLRSKESDLDSSITGRLENDLNKPDRSSVGYRREPQDRYTRRGDLQPITFKRSRVEYEEPLRPRQEDTDMVHNSEEILQRIVRQELEAMIARAATAREKIERL